MSKSIVVKPEIDPLCECGYLESEHAGLEGWCPSNDEDRAFSTTRAFKAAACPACKGVGSRPAEANDEYISAACGRCNGSGFYTGEPEDSKDRLLDQALDALRMAYEWEKDCPVFEAVCPKCQWKKKAAEAINRSRQMD